MYHSDIEGKEGDVVIKARSNKIIGSGFGPDLEKSERK